MEEPDELITLDRAAALAGLAVETLRHQAWRGKLQVRRLGHNRFTTRRWLHAYLTEAAERSKGRRLPLPESYEPPG